MSSLSWGIIGTGSIARKFASELPHSKTGTLVAVGSRSQEKADEFAGKFPGIRAHASYEALLADPEVQAVYISTPHPQHAEWAIAAAEAGKHILCEKPLALNSAEAMTVIEAARRNGVFLMEAFMYRCHPRTARIAELVKNGAVGQVKLIRANFSFSCGYDPESRVFSNALGGGGIMDVGCYTTSITRLVAGAASGQDFLEPLEVTGSAALCETGVDTVAVATLKFPGDILAQISCGVMLDQPSDLEILGTEGTIRVPQFWNPPGPIHIIKGDRQEIVESDENPHKYALEADALALALPAQECPQVSWEDTLSNMRTLDRWRDAVKVVFKAEAIDAPELKATVSRRPLQRNRWAEIPQARVNGLSNPVSRLVLGVDTQPTLPYLAAMADDFVERGGSAFDTAHIYGGGRLEAMLGQWMENRGIREEVSVLVKGAHTPFCTPEHLREQFQISLDRLQTGYADIYLMHRDNPAVPASEFVDVLDELHHKGQMKLYGGSNWSLERLNEANAYAKKAGKMPFRVVSNNLSLARMVDPVWAGCVSAKGAEWRRWFLENDAVLFSWSSQARGYFAPHRFVGSVSDAELLRCWDSEDNQERRRRAQTLADEKNVSPLNIALAYVLSQPFDAFALIGPRTITETRTALNGVGLKLTPGELAWVDLETDKRK